MTALSSGQTSPRCTHLLPMHWSLPGTFTSCVMSKHEEHDLCCPLSNQPQLLPWDSHPSGRGHVSAQSCSPQHCWSLSQLRCDKSPDKEPDVGPGETGSCLALVCATEILRGAEACNDLRFSFQGGVGRRNPLITYNGWGVNSQKDHLRWTTKLPSKWQWDGGVRERESSSPESFGFATWECKFRARAEWLRT